MRLFGRKAAGPAARPALLRSMAGTIVSGDWPRSYDAQVRDAYLSNPVAQRAVRLVAEGAGGVSVVATPAGHQAERLIRTTSAGQHLIETVAAHLLLHGNAFIQILPDAEGEPAELYALRPERVWVAAAGVSAGWRRAALTISLDGGTSWTGVGSTAAPAVIGTANDALGAGSAALLDRINSVEVELLNDSMWLESRTDAALAGGANLAMLGEELIQFGSAEQTGPRTFRLSRMMRGRRGSEWAMAGHVTGERFVLIEAAGLMPLELSSAAIGSVVKVMAQGVGDGGVAAEAETLFLGRALRPPPPVRLFADRLGDGTVRIDWTRRSRTGWAWLDGGDAPLGEEAERYRLTIMPSVGAARIVELGAPGYDYGAAEQAADGSAGASSITVSVIQLGSVAASLPSASGVFDI